MNSSSRNSVLFINRFTILHLGLLPRAENGRSEGEFSESSSLEEMCEHILYFFDSRHANSNQNGIIGLDLWKNRESLSSDSEICPELSRHPISDEKLEAAIKFSGLCRTFYSLPSIIQKLSPALPQSNYDVGSNSSNGLIGRSEEVHLSSSTLIFIPLEVSNHDGIVAVADMNCSPSRANDANPHAIRIMVQKAHTIFQLIYFGGIHFGLGGLDLNGKPRSYRGMEELYACYRALTKVESRIKDIELKGGMYTANTETLSTGASLQIQDFGLERETLQKQIYVLTNTLPLDSIRKDLGQFYDSLLNDIDLKLKRGLGSGRCLIEALPTPLTDARSSKFRYPQFSTSSNILRELSRFASSLLPETDDYSEEASNDFESPPKRESVIRNSCVGLSIFCEGRHLVSRMKRTESNLSPETACGLLKYLLSYTQKSCHHEVENTFFIDWISCAMHSGMNDRRQDKGTFIPPPLSSVISKFDHINKIFVPKLGTLVWMPKIFLPSQHSVLGTNAIKDTYAVLYQLDSVNIIFYLRFSTHEAETSISHESFEGSTWGEDEDIIKSASMEQSWAEQSDSIIVQVLTEISNFVEGSLSSLIIDGMSSPEESSNITEFSSEVCLEEEGVDIVIVDRNDNSLIMLCQGIGFVPSQTSSNHKEKVKNRLKIPLLDIGRDTFEPSHSERLLFQEDFDCRHILASHISSEGLCAFDEIFDEIHRTQTKTTNLDRFELCSSNPEYWIYGGTQHQLEVYILFDSKLFSNIADIQKKVDEVWMSLVKK